MSVPDRSQATEAVIVAAIDRRSRAWSEALDASKRAGEALERAADALTVAAEADREVRRLLTEAGR